MGERWAKIHLAQLHSFLKFRLKDGQQQAPSDTILSRILEKLSLTDLQTAFAEFINALLPETELIAAVQEESQQLEAKKAEFAQKKIEHQQAIDAVREKMIFS